MSVKVQSWVWLHSRAIGNDRLVLLAIADCCDDEGFNAYPSIATLANKTRLHPATVRRCIRNVESIGELAVSFSCGRQSNMYAIQIDTLPLGHDSRRQRRITKRGPGGRRQHQPAQFARVDRKHQPPRYRGGTPRGTAESPPAVPRADPSLNPSVPETATTSAPVTPPAAPAQAVAAAVQPDPPRRPDVEAFLAWWQLEYPAENHGALNVPTYSTAGAVVAELLAHRTVADLQALALALWRDRDDAWIFASDRSVFVLKHRADYLDRRRRELAPPAPEYVQPDWITQAIAHAKAREGGSE